MMRKIFLPLFLALLLPGTAPVAAQETPAKEGGIRNFLRVNEQFCTGGQPTAEELARLKADGIKAVINLRRPGEYDHAAEEAKVKELGLRYFNIPVDSNDPKDEQVAEFLKLTDDEANRPAFIHCGSANRVGAFWMIRRVLRDGWEFEKADEEARKIGLRDSKAREFALAYLEKNKKK
jgi:uncharacterized protein (TIGR01244 family)